MNNTSDDDDFINEKRSLFIDWKFTKVVRSDELDFYD